MSVRRQVPSRNKKLVLDVIAGVQLVFQADNIAELYKKPRLPHEPVVKDDVLRYNPAEDLLIQINNLLSYFVETDEIKPVTVDLRSEVIYEISQGVLLLEEVCEFHVVITYSQFQHRRDLKQQFEKRTSRLFCIRCDLLIHREGRPSWHFLREKTPNIKAKKPKTPEGQKGAGSSKEEPKTFTAGEEPSNTSKPQEVADHPKTDEEVVDHPKAEEDPGFSEVSKVDGPNLEATGAVEKYKRLDDRGILLWCTWEERDLAPENRPFTDAFLFMRGLLAQRTFSLIKQVSSIFSHCIAWLLGLTCLSNKKMQEAEARNALVASSFLRRLMTTLAQRADMLPDFLFLTDVIPGKLLGAGAFGDVLMGSYEGRKVALKTLRIFAGVDLTGYKEKLMSIKQIARGMTYLHEQNVVHGDLRGDNIFLDENFDVHIADFGLSVFADGASGNYHSVRTGNPRWLAVEVQFPERFPHISASGRPTYAADLYTRGKAPFYHIPGDHAITMHIGSGGRAPRPVNPDNDEMPEALWNLVERCWREMPEERPTFSDISKELEIILS
ncbi:hypothetical protein PHLCEN_2v13422 [Hermanssonia centrifuga]|uniref:Protein kinase domain-containing protein n=1 Tax=Hermanssonia centrifuga TaxID=98765 RepID=A0A2R6NFB4_9APHY|nr:hypothetical protein PHLCEN_2v13422 [Hermanssonia centrifuga]